MKDPYQVLNVTATASDDEVKRAYRDLARKYHPDNYVNNPLSDLAQEKMKEINEAYDTIVKSRQNGGSSNQSSYGGGYSARGNYGGYRTNSYSSNPSFQKIRQLITQGNISLAESMLDQMSAPQRDAEWYFLKGTVCYRKGWTDDARRNFETACSRDPQNQEYRSALNMMNGNGQGYNPYQGQQGTAMGGCTPCDCCAGMMCMDMCCNCY